MRLAGYQPLTLIDYPGHLAAIIFTQGCPFRCVYCHNPDLLPIVGANELPIDEVLAHLKKDQAMLNGVVVTGGEPTLHPDLPDFLLQLKSLGLHVKLDTNGVNPRLVEKCLALGLVDFVAMDIKHRWEKYQDIIGSTPDIVIDNCKKTLALIREFGVAHEFRTTVYSQLHTVDDILTIAGYLQAGESYALQPVRGGVTLQPNLPLGEPLDLFDLKQDITSAFPYLQVEIKN